MIKLKVEKSVLFASLSKIAPAAGLRPTMPILSNALLSAKDGVATMTATDLEVYSRVEFDAEILEEGEFTLPMKLLLDTAKSAPSGIVSIEETESHRAKIRYGGSQTTLYGLEASSFPREPANDSEASFKVDRRLLADAVAKTIYAVTEFDDTYNLSGVLFLREDCPGGEERLCLAATDTQRMSVAMVDVMEGAIAFPGVDRPGALVPAKGVKALTGLDGHESAIELAFSESHMFVKAERRFLAVRLLDGAFPDYKKVLPPKAETDIEVTVNREGFLSALRRGSLLVDPARHVVSTFAFSDNLLTVTIENPNLGKFEESIKARYAGSERLCAYNPEYFQAALGALASEDVTLRINEKDMVALNEPNYQGVIVGSSIPEH